MYDNNQMYDNPLAKAYVVYQVYPTTFFNSLEALHTGTIFPELYRPYEPKAY